MDIHIGIPTAKLKQLLLLCTKHVLSTFTENGHCGNESTTEPISDGQFHEPT